MLNRRTTRAYTIPARPVAYKNTEFRSVLEGRWAVFFTTLGIRWRYEPKKFEYEKGRYYLPDFYLPDVMGGLWVEIKPTSPTTMEKRKIRAVSSITGNNAAVLHADFNTWDSNSFSTMFHANRSRPIKNMLFFENPNVKEKKERIRMFIPIMSHWAGLQGWSSETKNIQHAVKRAREYKGFHNVK